MIGQAREAALWYKTPEQRAQAEGVIREVFHSDALEGGLIFGPLSFEDADLASRRAPKPPEDGAKLLVGSACVLAISATPGEKFVLDLNAKDLAILRKVTQDAWMKYPSAKPLSVDQIDKVIAETSQDVLEKMLQYAHARRTGQDKLR